ncbi:hypothetical protein L202_05121 [Cryptococcus amylolentus CBS 6039]|uniref:Clustered mitochondria protein homolog n=1 Tax=Cryptococcus amylolentus CBS 6039 TaxID=1295533 RepID=A0A1E3HNW9_9TREE|nr:hypothetical protein L202_05121 [Cryptococcus amylolentus CBS 6039]ODN78038.1 hypothetical protein L202_05121 [Cryptococcus amylolentus CBS 6039]
MSDTPHPAQDPPQEDAQLEQDPDQQQEIQFPAVVVRIPAPTCPRTVPKQDSAPTDRITLYPKPGETIQDIKLLINDWVGAYWLGPYSLRLPFVKGEDGKGQVYTKKKDFSEVRAGEKLNEWLEVADAFEHVAEGEERVLEAVKEPYGEFSARQSILRLIELIAPAGTTANTLSNPLGLSAGATIFERVRDGLSADAHYEEVEVALPSGRKGKAGKKEVVKVKREVTGDRAHAFADFKDWQPASFASLPVSSAPSEIAPAVRSIQVSPFNPPPAHLRQQGHQLYLTVSLLEGETLTLVCTTRGWYVSKSNVNNFDATPRDAAAPIHSLVDLLHSISPRFSERISALPPISLESPIADPISTVAPPQAQPAYPFLASLPKPATTAEQLRTQLAFLHTGAYGPEGVDSARDWNEELQGIRELPRSTMQERVMRERMLQKTIAEFDTAAIRAVLSISSGDVPPINPAEPAEAYMYLQSNVFVTPGDNDALDAYAHLGGDGAMRVSHGKDAAGIRSFNKVDVDGLYTLGHTVVDWMGKRWVCQSVLPGIFSNRRALEEEVEAKEAKGEEKDEKKEDWVDVTASPKAATSALKEGEEAEPELDNPMMIYGLDSERPTTVHWDALTHKLFATYAALNKLAPHSITSGTGEKHEFYASAEVKGLKGQDGRRYVLDGQRTSPVDVEWLEKDVEREGLGEYPHKLVLLRPELVEIYWDFELKRWAKSVSDKAAKKQKESEDAEKAEESGEKEEVKSDEKTEEKALVDEHSPAASAAAARRAEEDAPIDTSVISDIKDFKLLFNADAFVPQPPAKEGSPAPVAINDESDPSVKAVRDASKYLRELAIPSLVYDVMIGVTSGVMDGESLSKHLHLRGVNVRYLGKVAETIESFSATKEGEEQEAKGYLQALQSIVYQEMVFRASKHIVNDLIKTLHPDQATQAVSHFLNCLLGSSLNPSPTAAYSPLSIGATEQEPAYVSLTVEGLRKQIREEVRVRYRYELPEAFLEGGIRRKQLLRELSLRVGWQMQQREYYFSKEEQDAVEEVKEDKKEKNKKSKAKTEVKRTTTFEPQDVLTLLPIVKSTAPSVSVAEEILAAGRNTINNGNVNLGLEFMLEAIQTYESIHSVIHPEVAAVYNQYAQAIHQIARIKIAQLAQKEDASPDEPLGVDVSTALKLQRQAVVIAERTLGIYHHETASYYFNLAMLENLEGNSQQALRYFKHVLTLWDVMYGRDHPEVNTVLNNAGIILQTAITDLPSSLALHQQAHESTSAIFGPSHLQTAQTLNQLVQSHFLAGNHREALTSAEATHTIFLAKLGEEHTQTKESLRNVELLTALIDGAEKQKEREEMIKKDAEERLKAARGQSQGLAGRLAGRRLGQQVNGNVPSGVRVIDQQTLAALTAAAQNGQLPASAAAAVAAAGQALPNGQSSAEGAADAAAGQGQGPRIGERGTENLEELVRYIQGGSAGGAGGAKRGKNALRGKRRTGSKR